VRSGPYKTPLRSASGVDQQACGPCGLDVRAVHTYIHTNLYSAKNRENESEALRMPVALNQLLPAISRALRGTAPRYLAEELS